MTKNTRNKLILIVGISLMLLVVTLCGCTEQRGITEDTDNLESYEENNLKSPDDQIEKSRPFCCKKVVIRDDDIGDSHHLPSLRWISDLTVSKDFKVTFSVIPIELVWCPETVDYLNQLDRNYFEFATHGYEHTHFGGLPYEEQYSLIENGTKIMQEFLHCKPVTFVPPYGSSDVNTTKALEDLDYHSITDNKDDPCYVIDCRSDFGYEKDYDPPIHHNFIELKSSFDRFYNSSDDCYVLTLHDWTFLDEMMGFDEAKADIFEEFIDYIKSKNIQFMTIEENYKWCIDKNIVQTGWINESNCYFIDLGECIYNHTIKFSSSFGWDGNVCLKDVTSAKEEIFYEDTFEFDGTKGHLYEICLVRI